MIQTNNGILINQSLTLCGGGRSTIPERIRFAFHSHVCCSVRLDKGHPLHTAIISTRSDGVPVHNSATRLQFAANVQQLA